MTELSPVSHLTPPGWFKPGSVGVTAPSTQTKIADPVTGADLGTGPAAQRPGHVLPCPAAPGRHGRPARHGQAFRLAGEKPGQNPRSAPSPRRPGTGRSSRAPSSGCTPSITCLATGPWCRCGCGHPARTPTRHQGALTERPYENIGSGAFIPDSGWRPPRTHRRRPGLRKGRARFPGQSEPSSPRGRPPRICPLPRRRRRAFVRPLSAQCIPHYGCPCPSDRGVAPGECRGIASDRPRRPTAQPRLAALILRRGARLADVPRPRPGPPATGTTAAGL